jgi:hypothetical protein
MDELNKNENFVHLSKINIKDYSLIEKLNNRLELYCNGIQRQDICWKYIYNDTCNHIGCNLDYGINICGLWHPNINDKNYLKIKNKIIMSKL